MELTGKNILVVGASGVLGGQITQRLAQLGARVLGTASSNQSAARIPDAASMKLLLDLESSASIKTLADYLVASEPLDGVVLAAGRVGFGKLDSTSAVDTSRLMQVNFLGQADLLTRLALALRPESFVAAITGVVAEKTFPGMASYCASKTALSVWLAASRIDFKRVGATTIELRPGHTETGLATRALFGEAPTIPQGMTPEHVADKTVEAILARTALVASEGF
ncbi:MAG: SDR family NAD(P)-dependent oxidoreductase [Microbacteriaceae bacterium]